MAMGLCQAQASPLALLPFSSGPSLKDQGAVGPFEIPTILASPTASSPLCGPKAEALQTPLPPAGRSWGLLPQPPVLPEAPNSIISKGLQFR